MKINVTYEQDTTSADMPEDIIADAQQITENNEEIDKEDIKNKQEQNDIDYFYDEYDDIENPYEELTAKKRFENSVLAVKQLVEIF